MPSMNLQMLGGMHLEVDGETVTAIKTERLQSLFAFLALHRAHPLRRDYVAFTLWPDCAEAVSRRRLRKAIHDLRAALPMVDHFISVHGQSIHWLPETVVQIDVEAFEGALAAASRVEREGRLANAARHIETAIDLYGGDLLPENYHEWFALRRRQLHNQFIDAMQSVSLLMERSTEYDKSIAYIKMLLRHESDLLAAHSEELHEATFSRLIRLSGRHLARSDVEWAYRMYAYNRSRYDMPVSAPVAAEYEAALLRATEAATITRKIPPRLTPFLGRRHELAELTDRLQDRNCRLVSVTGVAGVGKTSLAQQVVRPLNAFVHGIFFVATRTAQNERQVYRLIVQALELPASQEMDVKESLFHFVEDKRLLLVLDGYEHLVDGAEWLIELFEHAPGVKVLVTSRVRLNLACEWIFELDGLGRPIEPEFGRAEGPKTDGPSVDDPDTDDSAVQLFLQTAQRVAADFAPVQDELAQIIRICRLVEGLPLAIELAAAWVRLFSCRQIARRIEQGLDLFDDGTEHVDGDHLGVRAALDYSWSLLAPEEQHTFLGLCTFRGHFDAEAAMAVTGASPVGLATLIDNSLLRRSESERYDMHNLIYQYGQAKLGKKPELQRRLQQTHCEYYIELVFSHTQALMEGRSASVQSIRPDYEHIVDAWHWAVDNHCGWAINRLYLGLMLYLYEVDLFRDGVEMCEKAIDAWAEGGDEDKASVEMRAKLQVACSLLAYLDGDHQKSDLLLDAAEPVIEQLGLAPEQAMAPLIRAVNAVYRGEYERAERHCLTARDLAYEQDYFTVWGAALVHLGDIERQRGRHAIAEGHYLRSLAQARAVQSNHGEVINLWRLGANALAQGELDEASGISNEALDMTIANGNKWVAQALLNQLGHIACARRQFEESEGYFRQALEIASEARGSRGSALDSVVGMCAILDHNGRAERAYQYLSTVLAHPAAHHQTLANAGALADRIAGRIPQEKAHVIQLRGHAKPLNVVIAELLLI